MFYTYMHTRNDTRQPFYIGKGRGQRAWASRSRNQHWKNVVQRHGHGVELLAHWPTEKEAFEHERFLIACMKDMGIKLVNMTDGGEGSSGFKLPEQAKQKLRALHLGKRPTAEALAKMSAAHRGISKTEAHKAAIGRAHKGKVIPGHVKAILSQKATGRKHTAESRMKMSALRAGTKASEAAYECKRVAVVCVETGKAYKSIADAAVWLCDETASSATLSSITSGISRHLNGKRSHTYGYHWKFKE
jgi:hypothetical protein